MNVKARQAAGTVSNTDRSKHDIFAQVVVVVPVVFLVVVIVVFLVIVAVDMVVVVAAVVALKSL